MSATLTWLDHDAEDRERMNRILALFRERDTRDELGVGVIRDLLADEFFPGTSTIQTRLRYMLFVPWIYQELEAGGCPSAGLAAQARKREVELVKALSESDDKVGVFGKRAGGDLRRLPSSVYWAGLGKWNIRRFNGSQEQYQAAIDDIYQKRSNRHRALDMARRRGEGLDAIGGMSSITWHPRIPPPPKGFPQTATLRLTRDEAQFIEDQIITTQPNSLFARIIPLPLADVDYPWQHPSLSRFTQEQRDLLHHAHLFSQVMYGAAILYNLMLARKKASAELVKARLEDAKQWLESLDRVGLDKWELDWVMPLAFNHQQAVSPHTLEFCKRWVELVRASGNSIMNEKTAQNLIQSREMRLKVGRSRFSNSRALDQWNGRAGLARMDYRWSTVKRFILDLREGLDGE
ncbi:MAG: DUF6361 family protein [Terracidiphilus sp.]|jgi:hypothetical protein